MLPNKPIYDFAHDVLAYAVAVSESFLADTASGIGLANLDYVLIRELEGNGCGAFLALGHCDVYAIF